MTERIRAGRLTVYHYDKNGSIISEEEEGRKSEYRYDLLNRQTYVKTLDGREQENLYDGEGLRAGLTENGKRTTFLYHNGEILTESEGESAPVRRYLTGLGLSHVQTEDGAYHAYHQDEQGSTVYVTGRGIENCYQYDAFGNLTEKKETITNRILYTGQQYDQETGQYYLRARYYNPVVGRFLQEDTYRGDGLNLYAYCANNPVMYFDPGGHMTQYEGEGVQESGDTLAGQVSNEPRVFTSTDPLVGEVATEIEKNFPGRVLSVNEIVYRPDGTRLTDLDIEMDTIVIQVKTGGGNKLTKQLVNSANSTGKIAIGYVPDIKPSVFKEATNNGFEVFRNMGDLLEFISQN